jgi:hypothetical protein
VKKTVKKKKLNIKQEPKDDVHPHVKLIIKKSPSKSTNIAEVMMQDISEQSSELLPEVSSEDSKEAIAIKPESKKKSDAKKKADVKKKPDGKKKLDVKRKLDVKKKPPNKKPPNKKYKPPTVKPPVPRPFRKVTYIVVLVFTICVFVIFII